MTQIKIGVIAAAGKGTRAYPKTSFIPKPLFKIENQSILEHNVNLLIEKFKVEKIYIVVGHLKQQVLEEMSAIQKKVKIQLEAHNWTQKGLASDIASLESKILDPFILILGDEFYYKSNHEAFLESFSQHPDLIASIGITKTNLLNRIRKNYSVELNEDQIINLIEKPEDPPNDLLGLGSYLFSPQYFSYFKTTPPSPKSGVIEITEVIDRMAKNSKRVFATMIKCDYFNINSMQDYHQALYEVRNFQFKNYKSSIIFSAHESKRSIADVVRDFEGLANEIVVVTESQVQDQHLKEIESSNFKLISAPSGINFHVGEQVRRGIEACDGEIIVVVAADGSFRAKDYPKLLEYLKDSDMVIGTRTTRQMIEQGANLKPLMRLVNLFLGKLIEIFWWGQEPRFTDIDCQYFAMWKNSYEKLCPELHCKDHLYVGELMIEFVRSHLRVIEIPISYYKPVEQTQLRLIDSVCDSIKMLKIIIQKKFFNS